VIDWLFDDKKKNLQLTENTKFAIKSVFLCVIPMLIHHYLSDHPGSYLRRASYPIIFGLSACVMKYFLEKQN
jgi:hypothetical protein